MGVWAAAYTVSACFSGLLPCPCNSINNILHPLAIGNSSELHYQWRRLVSHRICRNFHRGERKRKRAQKKKKKKKKMNRSSSTLSKRSSGNTSLHLRRTASSTQLPTSPTSAPVPDSKLPLIEFPSSPHSTSGEPLIHYTHAKHPIARISLPDLFVCSGCKEYGSGKRFTCQDCDFQLHEFCALSPPVLKSHPLHGQHQVVFHSRPRQAGISWPKCDVCGKSLKGFTFRCRACSFQMHPCCAMLSTEMTFRAHAHPLKLLPPPVNGEATFVCGECKRKRSGRVYHCAVCGYHLHAVCAKAMINGIHENGLKVPEKPSMMVTAARLASQVVIEFIGGLIEGFGEGVGEVLIQNIARGRGRNRARASRAVNQPVGRIPVPNLR